MKKWKVAMKIVGSDLIRAVVDQEAARLKMLTTEETPQGSIMDTVEITIGLTVKVIPSRCLFKTTKNQVNSEYTCQLIH